MMADFVIRGGTVVDATGERRADVAVSDGSIVGVEETITSPNVLDAQGCVVAPGLVDLHTHLREPGRETAETIESGSRSAALGGFTAVVAMPNTTPSIDCAAVVREVQQLGASALCDVEVAGAITLDRAGIQLAPMAEMADLGVRLFTDDGRGVQDDRLMRRALEYSSGLGLTLAQHCENEVLSQGGHMHEGAVSSILGIPGIPAEAEELMVMRDVALSRLTGGSVHFQHLSTAGSVQIVRAAREAGLPVTAEVTPHHFTLTDAEVRSYNPEFKVNPPLRTMEDVAAIKAAMREGNVIDAIATDHAPHEPHLKELPFDEAPCGIVGLETALALSISELELPVLSILGLLSWQPAAVAGIEAIHGGPVEPGRSANLVVFDPDEQWLVKASDLASRSSNSPFDGRTLRGRVRHTVLHGEVVVCDGEAQR